MQLRGALAEGDLDVAVATFATSGRSVTCGGNGTAGNTGSNVGTTCAAAAAELAEGDVLADTVGVVVPLLGQNDCGGGAGSTGATATVACATTCGDDGLVAVEVEADGGVLESVTGTVVGTLFLLGAIVVVDQVGVGCYTVTTGTGEAGATIVTGLGGLVNLLVVGGGEAQNTVRGLAGVQSGLSTTVTTDTVCATFTGLNGFADRVVSVVDTEAFKTCRTRCTVSGTTGGTEDDVAVALCAGGPLPRSGHCASFHVLGVVVSATVVDEASATTATCDCNGGTVDNQSGGATTGCGVGNTLQGGS